MNAKEYLKQVRKFDVLINIKSEELQRLNDFCTKITTTLSFTKTSNNVGNDKIGDTISKIVDLKEEINNDIDKYINLRNDVMNTIDKLEDSRMCEILYKRYFDGLIWEQIAVDLNFTFQWVHRLHADALKLLQEIIDVDNTNVL